MARKGYTTIALPDELVSEIDEVIKIKKRGYTSRAELIKESVRLILDKLNKQK
ncbi:MAG: ribbon-helix-helix domain-containing protein [Candidatus Nanoarchaeia archaeon]|nr:ribbon-helix-helix domain-containing protein [Candidatus Nanoarchaeia archaeon]